MPAALWGRRVLSPANTPATDLRSADWQGEGRQVLQGQSLLPRDLPVCLHEGDEESEDYKVAKVMKISELVVLITWQLKVQLGTASNWLLQERCALQTYLCVHKLICLCYAEEPNITAHLFTDNTAQSTTTPSFEHSSPRRAVWPSKSTFSLSTTSWSVSSRSSAQPWGAWKDEAGRLWIPTRLSALWPTMSRLLLKWVEHMSFNIILHYLILWY